MRRLLPLSFVLLTLSGGANLTFAGRLGASGEIREYQQTFPTYPYSDPDPVPAMTRYYPYFRYDGFTDQPVAKAWKVVELSNEHLRLLILPEVGGKVWAAIDKSTGRSFIYYNHAVKFRDISMRGPWTSGGMEANYGIIGHTPNCFSPVDYITRHNPDGSVSCTIGTLDLLTRTEWRMEINLPAGEAGFTTRSFWHNSSGEGEPYYTWMNIGLKAAGNLQFVNPGTHYLGHDGKVFAWPVNPDNGHDISWYDRNDFGPYKSYHVFGRLSEFFGGYYHDEDYGMAHSANFDDKPGRKVWIWGLSRQGMIWEKLLTDTDGQYIEVQSGRLFNQTADESTVTPFKHRQFEPFATDTWTEHWQPVKGIGGFVVASPWGAMNVTRTADGLQVRISPCKPGRAPLEVFDGTNRLWAQTETLQPLHPLAVTVPLAAEPKALRVTLGGDHLAYAAGDDDVLSRPTAAPAGFNWDSAYGLYLKGRENLCERNYSDAWTNFLACVQTSPDYVPALVELAGLANRRAAPAQAADYARHALSVDAYDPAANYQFGRASLALGKPADAQDAFSIAAEAPGWHSAAETELARLFLRAGRWERARASARSALDQDRRNLSAWRCEAVADRLAGDRTAAAQACEQMLALDPLCHFARAENFLRGDAPPAEFTRWIRNELPGETYLELAAWYHNAGRDADAARLLALSPTNAEVLYWRAYLAQDPNLLAQAGATSPAGVFPFRAEAVPVFEWASTRDASWHPRYLLALVKWGLGETNQARDLLAGCGEAPDFAPFYATRAQLAETNAEQDLVRAAQLDPAQWRFGVMRTKLLLKQEHSPEALAVSTDYAARFPSITVLALLKAKALVLNARYDEAVRLLDGLNVLPCEGSTDARATWREALLMQALDRLRAGEPAAAQTFVDRARDWPEHLGAGKPYPADTDERLEDWLAYQCARAANDPAAAKAALDRIVSANPPPQPGGCGPLLRALALRESGRATEAAQVLADWGSQPGEKIYADWGNQFYQNKVLPPPSGAETGFRVLSAWRPAAHP